MMVLLAGNNEQKKYRGKKEQVGENFNYNSTVTLRQFNGASFVRTAEKACGCLGKGGRNPGIT